MWKSDHNGFLIAVYSPPLQIFITSLLTKSYSDSCGRAHTFAMQPHGIVWLGKLSHPSENVFFICSRSPMQFQSMLCCFGFCITAGNLLFLMLITAGASCFEIYFLQLICSTWVDSLAKLASEEFRNSSTVEWWYGSVDAHTNRWLTASILAMVFSPHFSSLTREIP